jgi:hypothetical protein
MYLMLMEAYDITSRRIIGRGQGGAREHSEILYERLPRRRWNGSEWASCQHTKPLLVDEYQALDATALRELLNIAEECKIPLVLCGNGERLAKERPSDKKALEQIWNQARPTFRVDPPDVSNCQALAIEHNVVFDKAVYAALESYGGRSSVRDLVCLLEEARAVAGTGAIQLAHIETAVLTIHGRRDALKLLTPAIAA